MEQFPNGLLVSWAQRQPHIHALHLVEDRGAETAPEKTDLDIALELTVPPDDQVLVFLSNRERWRRELRSLTGMIITELALFGPSWSVWRSTELYRRSA